MAASDCRQLDATERLMTALFFGTRRERRDGEMDGARETLGGMRLSGTDKVYFWACCTPEKGIWFEPPSLPPPLLHWFAAGEGPWLYDVRNRGIVYVAWHNHCYRIRQINQRNSQQKRGERQQIGRRRGREGEREKLKDKGTDRETEWEGRGNCHNASGTWGHKSIWIVWSIFHQATF